MFRHWKCSKSLQRLFSRLSSPKEMGFKNLPSNTKHQSQHSSISTSLMRLHPKPAAEPSTARLQEIPDIMASSSLTTNSTTSQEEWLETSAWEGPAGNSPCHSSLPGKIKIILKHGAASPAPPHGAVPLESGSWQFVPLQQPLCCSALQQLLSSFQQHRFCR